MATTTVNSLISRAALVAQDIEYVRWHRTEWLDWLNDAQREIVLVKPSACVKNVSVKLTPGATKHTIPGDGVTLVDVTRNMGQDGNTYGDAIRVTQREVLDSQRPGWHYEKNVANKIAHFCFDSRDPKTFYVYPKAPASAHFVEVVYSSTPVDCVLDGTIHLDDIYATVLLNLMLYRAYSKDAEYAQNAQLAVAYYQAAMSSLGVKTQAEKAANPNNSLTTPSPIK